MRWWFVLPLDGRAVVHYLGRVLRLLALLLLVPLVVATANREAVQALVFAGLAGGAGLVGWVAGRGRAPPLPRREAIAITALVYPLAAVVGAPAFLTVASPADALFESMSGFTTTGLSVMDVEQLPASLLFFRSYAQWLGGAGIVVLSLVVLATGGGAATKLYAAEAHGENLFGNVLATGRVVAVTYAGLTALALAALVAAGAGWFDGLLHALSLVSTGGFTPLPDSIGGYDSAAIAGVTIVFMVLAALSLPLYYLTWRHGWRRLVGDPQLLLLLGLIVGGTVVAVAFEGWGGGDGLAALFHVTSAATTSGFTLTGPGEWAEGTRLLAIGHMFVGGGVGSTTGGLKLLRALLLMLLAGWVIMRFMVPREVAIPLRLGALRLSEEEVRYAVALAVAAAGVAFVSALLLTATGAPFSRALFDVVSALNTVGLSTGVAAPDLPIWGKLTLVVDMWAGRVEILPVIMLLHPLNWGARTGGRREDPHRRAE